MKSEPRCHINERLHTEFANSGRAAGMGISYDRYDEESGYRPQPKELGAIRFPSDYYTAEEWEKLNGEVRIIKQGHEAGKQAFLDKLKNAKEATT